MINGTLGIDHPIRWGMVGGGKDSFIGYIHRSAALRDRSFAILAGAFARDSTRCRDFGVSIGVDASRCYGDYKTLFSEESKRKDGIEAVTIATPNNTHYEISKAALEAGLHVICEKPLCFKTEEAEELAALAEKKGLIYGVTYGYSGYQMIHQASAMVARGDLGKIRLVNMQFAYGSFNTNAVEEANAYARWRLDPTIAGPSFVIGDIGTHCLFLSETIAPELKLEKLLCTSQTFVKTRQLEDNAYVLLQYKGGAAGMLWVSSVNCGCTHGQKIRVIGEKASIEWWDEHPNQLRYEIEGEPVRILDRGAGYLYSEALAEDRIVGGHPEGLFESWSNLYRRYAIAIDAAARKDTAFLKSHWYPDVKAGVRGVRFVNACVQSAEAGSAWVQY
ncbi:oxidoreductase domain protein [Treponema primitia ZAS-2]|uniref:Oxidoreductase domain protein n=1 Tax=Treponema primitia (strain ATCC BAA-887 / DSM 12427 / ZAS-2) TaxID=545694 RepID=F5YJN7_TREPZ|nr:Gfo/Idh/MocA family oxidoreductase [Treponema primitia]AEF86861.1 oxidoreductase domain protein [Treponema primitia ZAS-2]